MTHYIISIVRDDSPDKVTVECETIYTLERDIPEWIKEEVDHNAQTITTGGDNE